MLTNTCPHCGKDRGNAGNTCPHCEARVERLNEPKQHQRSSFNWGVLIILGLLVIFITCIPNLIIHKNSTDFLTCQQNEKDLGTALEMYAKDSKGTYPAQLQDLVPMYLEDIPTCRAAHGDTYSPSYVCSKTKEDYTFICKGENHRGVVFGDYPQYNSQEGLIIGK